ncbi:MAG: AAA family ATPase [bacterium]|nr:AAA family ATPase [Candidatus Limimorpha equi]
MDNHEETKQDLAELLTTNHNLILTGAPGTGKTYLAKQIAQQLIFGEVKENLTDDEQKQFDEQCGFVQFHPSYDYTDFVEGLRPIQDDNGNVGFERKDGVFKEFCKKAEKNWIDSKKSIDVLQKEFDNKELIDSFLSNAINEETIYKTKNGTEFNITDFDDDIISIKILRNKTQGNIDIDININKHKLVKLLENDLQLNNVRDIKQFFGYTNTQHRDSYIFTICNEIRNLSKVNSVQIDPIVCKNFVFIIDEINRGEISKIFGELFFSIDPGYRGKNGKVKTQYQNLIEVGDEFYDGFFVPENVYIIGTMNDIDRSVESMDFAFRRRFAFKEIKADDNIEMLEELGELKDEAIERMKRLNAEISKIEGLSSAYHIGAAYFLKLKNYASDADNGFENLWSNHLEGLLREYLRGSLNIEESIAKLKAAYNNESPENNG